jgi:hypothetical protein
MTQELTAYQGSAPGLPKIRCGSLREFQEVGIELLSVRDRKAMRCAFVHFQFGAADKRQCLAGRGFNRN